MLDLSDAIVERSKSEKVCVILAGTDLGLRLEEGLEASEKDIKWLLKSEKAKGRPYYAFLTSNTTLSSLFIDRVLVLEMMMMRQIVEKAMINRVHIGKKRLVVLNVVVVVLVLTGLAAYLIYRWKSA